MARKKARYKREDDPLFISYKDKILQFGNTVPTPNLKNVGTRFDISHWYTNSTQHFKLEDISHDNYVFDQEKFTAAKIKIKTRKILCYPTQQQANILNKWFEADKQLYNQTVLFLRKNIPYFLIRQYKTHYVKTKYYYRCEKNIKELVLKKNKLNKEKQRALVILNKKLNIVKKNKVTIKNLIDKKKQIGKLNKVTIKNLIDMIKQIAKLNKKNKGTIKNLICKKKQIAELNKKISNINMKISKIKHEQDNCKNDLRIYKNLDEKIKKYTDYQYIRTNYLKDVKNEIQDKYKDYNILSHSLDASIKRACSSYKSGITNLLDNNIKRFRVKCLNDENNIGIIEIEKSACRKNGDIYHICKKTLGCMKYRDIKRNNKIFKIERSATSSFYFDGSRYWLLYYDTVQKTNNGPKNPYISLDMGVRTFGTGFTKNSVVNYGIDIYDKIKIYLNKIDKLNKTYTIDDEINICSKIVNFSTGLRNMFNSAYQSAKIIKRIHKMNRSIQFNSDKVVKLNKIKNKPKDKIKYEKYMNKRKHDKANRYYDIIKRKIDELHWKTALDLASNYETVVIGKLSTHSMCEGNKIVNMVKRVGTMMKHYQFRSKLVYKCLSMGTKIIVSSEKYTTKMCSICGHYNGHVKGEKEIKCLGCKKKYARDAYSARGILINNLERIE